MAAASGAASFVALVLYVNCAPFDPPESRFSVPGTVFLDRHGTVLQRDTSAGLRIPVALAQVSPVMIEATVAAEDERFWRHPGVDPLAIARALRDWRSNPSGASTITQQLARRLYLRGAGGPPLLRKGREALIALQIEAHGSKDEVLAAYLNEVYYGRGAYGVEAAARVYFGTSAANLGLAEAAFLAGLPQLPGAFEREDGLDAARQRQRYVLERMASTGKVSRAAAAEAGDTPLVTLPELAPAIAPHFVAWAKTELEALLPALAGQPGLVVETTLDAGLQQEAERVARLHLSALRERDAGNAAVIVLEPASGRVLVMAQAADFGDEANAGEVNMALALRQPGSALKPFLYAAAFERGYTPASMLLDVPTTFDTPSGPYSPLNYDREFHGPVPLRVALASSYNVPAVRTLDAIGVPALLEIAHRFGLSTLTDAEVYGLALTLGGGEVRLLDLAGAYGALAAGGVLARPYAIERVRDSSGRVLYERRQTESPTRVLSAAHAFLLADILADREARVPGFGQTSALELAFPAAVKTGTTTGFRDNWAIGFTPERVVAAWAGNADGRPMISVSGVAGAAPIFRDVMEAAAAEGGRSWPEPPAGLVRAVVCAPTGLLPGPDCPSRAPEWFAAGTEPRTAESYFARGAAGELAVNPPAEARAWALAAGIPLAAEAANQHAVFVVEPAAGSVFVRAQELREQHLLLRASAPPGTVAVEFWVDGSLAGASASSPPQVTWPLEPGLHALEVRARLASGGTSSATSTYEVR